MAILTDNPGRRVRVPLLLLLLAAVATGCGLLSVFGSGNAYTFSHRVHGKEGLECADCHTGWNSADAPGMPTRGGCVLCHEEIDKKKPPERRIDTLFDGDVYKARHVSNLADEVKFSHKQHVTKPIECKACHVGIDESDDVGGVPALAMQDCQSCHRQQNAQNECVSCHKTLRVDVAPASHAMQWKKVHGPTFRAHDAASVNQCSLCHQESTCKTCHEVEQPDNHGNYFRRRGHGLYARMDRQNCAACHRSDSCDTCHQDTRPISHTGTFGGTVSNHCLGCHLPVQSTECVTCHKSTPSHDLAPPKPPNHAPGMNCRQCHGVGQPLPHADNGSDCAMCHR